MADSLDVEQTSVGAEADLPQRGQVVQPLADGEVARVVDRGFSAKGTSLLVVLLDAGVLVVEVQRGHHALGDDAGAEPPWGPPRHPAIEDQLHVVGAADVEILADHLFEEDASGQGPIQYLGQGELSLQDGDVVGVAGGMVMSGEGVG